VHKREPYLIADCMIAPDLTGVNLVVLAEPPRDLHHARRHIQMKCRPKLGKMGPLRQRLQMVDGLSGFDLDDHLNSLATLLGVEHEVGIERRRTVANRRVLFRARVHLRLIPAPASGLQQADDTIVL
jgi:hypothetical protein